MFWKVLSFLKGRSSGLPYEAQKRVAESGKRGERLTLARDSATSREILYYLAENDPDPVIRKAVVNNRSVPIQVSPLLAADSSEDVRLTLARRLVQLLPDVSQDKHSQLYAYAVQALGTLALDEVLKIRIALSSTLKDHAHTPPKVAGQLARDIEREVSEPILRFCAALSEEDLVDILKGHPASWAVQAVAARKAVSAAVSAAVIRTNDRPGGKRLLQNEGAQISETLLMEIVEKSRHFPEWQKPVAGRNSLPPSIAKALAGFVDSSVRDLLLQRRDFDPQSAEEIATVFRRRMEFADATPQAGGSIEDRLDDLEREGRLGEDAVSDALAMRDRDFAVAAVARLAKIEPEDSARIFSMQSPKPVVALSWKANLPMRTALLLQKDLAQIPHQKLIYPRGGTDYPMTEAELNWQLEFLGLKKK